MERKGFRPGAATPGPADIECSKPSIDTTPWQSSQLPGRAARIAAKPHEGLAPLVWMVWP